MAEKQTLSGPLSAWPRLQGPSLPYLCFSHESERHRHVWPSLQVADHKGPIHSLWHERDADQVGVQMCFVS